MTLELTEPLAPAAPAVGRVVVLHVAESWGAGTRSAVLRMVAALPEAEHHLLRGTARAEYDPRSEDLFASVHELPPSPVAALASVRRTASRVAPAVVHAHSSLAGGIVRLALRSRAGRRIVYSPHCFAFERRDLPAPVRTMLRLAERVLAVNTATIVACSPAEASAAARFARDVVLAPNVGGAVPAEPVARIPGLVVGAGRLGAQKDPDFYRATIRLLAESAPGLRPRWIGGGDDDRRARLEADGIPVTGWLPQHEAAGELAAADVYLHTAGWDGFPLAIVEAVGLGVPVLARDVPSLAGATATPGLRTPAELAAAAAELLAGGAAARERNLDAWRRVLAANTPAHVASALRAAYAPATRRPLRINGKWLAANASGMQRYAGEVARRLLARDPSARVVVPRGAVLPPWLPEHRVDRARLTGVAFEQLELPLRRGTIVGLAGPGPLVRRDQLVVMHDATPARHPETFSRAFVLWYRLMYRVLGRRARHLATVSEFSRGELADVLGIPASRFVVAPDGHEHVLDALLAEPAPAVDPGGYVLCIGNLTPSKNLAPVTRALAKAGIRVVVVGAAGPSRVFAAEAGLDVPGVELAGRLSDPELARLLRDARALVFPSLYEGFGLPIVEAQALGCPVIASHAASIPEVAGAGARYFDPRRPEEAVALVRGLTEAHRLELAERGRRNVLRYAWDDTAAIILRELERPAA